MRSVFLLARAARFPALLASAIAVTACAGNGDGLDSNGRPIGEGGTPPPPTGQADFQQIQDTIFTPICTACHAGAGAPQGLRLDAANSYALLVNTPSAEAPSVLRVKPGDPDSSYIVQKIEGRASVGGRMPLGGPALPQTSIDLVRQWIAAGAQPATAKETLTASPLHVLSTIPEASESDPQPVGEVLVIMNKEVEPSLVSTETVALQASGGDGRFDDGNEQLVRLQSVKVSDRNMSVIVVKPAAPLANGTYRLVLKGTGPTAVAGTDASVLDGNGDGQPGGDFTTTFQIGAGGAQ
jgi:hypothetical protein